MNRHHVELPGLEGRVKNVWAGVRISPAVREFLIDAPFGEASSHTSNSIPDLARTKRATGFAIPAASGSSIFAVFGWALFFPFADIGNVKEIGRSMPVATLFA